MNTNTTNSWVITLNSCYIAVLDKRYFSAHEAYQMIMGFAVDPVLNGAYFDLLDGDTGEILFSYGREDEVDEPADIDDDCGFDPYLGAYSDDC